MHDYLLLLYVLCTFHSEERHFIGDLGCGYKSQVEDCLDADLAALQTSVGPRPVFVCASTLGAGLCAHWICDLLATEAGRIFLLSALTEWSSSVVSLKNQFVIAGHGRTRQG